MREEHIPGNLLLQRNSKFNQFKKGNIKLISRLKRQLAFIYTKTSQINAQVLRVYRLLICTKPFMNKRNTDVTKTAENYDTVSLKT